MVPPAFGQGAGLYSGDVAMDFPSIIWYESRSERMGTTWPAAEFVGGPYSPNTLLLVPVAWAVFAYVCTKMTSLLTSPAYVNSCE